MTERCGARGPVYRSGVALGVVQAPHHPRPRSARIFYVGADSSHHELVAGLVLSALEVVLVGANAFRGPLSNRLMSGVALILMVNVVRAVRQLLQRSPATRGRDSTR